jgi:alpha-ribazole phosphatase
MNAQTNLWLIRHAPVDGSSGVIHGPDAPADLGDATGFAALKARLPGGALAVCSPARRTRETAERLGLVAVEQAAFREQDFGAWTGRRHNELERELGPAYREFWKSPASNRPPGGESFVDRSRARALDLRLYPQARRSSSCIPAPSAPCSPSPSILRPSRRCAS